MGRALWIPDYLAEDGLDPVVLPGFDKRGRDGLDASAVVGHHIGIAGGGNAPGLKLVTHGHGKLAGNSLCNVHQARNGRPTAVASGVAWHAGIGGFRGLKGNPKALGIEAEGTTGEPMSDRQWDWYARIAASLLRGLHREEGWFCVHHEWRAEKPDAWALIHTRGGVPAFRQRVARHLHRTPTTPQEALRMGYIAAQIVAGHTGPWPNGRWTFIATTPEGQVDVFNDIAALGGAGHHFGDMRGKPLTAPIDGLTQLVGPDGRMTGYVLLSSGDGGTFTFGAGQPARLAA